jgi:hypothetical protein
MTKPEDRVADTEGLGDEPKDDWERIELAEGERPIDLLKPKSKKHDQVLDYLMTRLDRSERAMQRFHPRWNVNELKMQAYITLPKYEQLLKNMNKQGRPPKNVSIIIPTSYATVATITTFMTHAFVGRRPVFQAGTYDDKWMPNARNLELVNQYNLDHNRFVRACAQANQDWQIYGVSAYRLGWTKEMRMRTRRRPVERLSYDGTPVRAGMETLRELTRVYEGNTVVPVDPYTFFPDPSVPMHLVAEKGEFVFWRTFEGKHQLLKDEADGILKWVNAAATNLGAGRWNSSSSRGASLRSVAYDGEPHPEEGDYPARIGGRAGIKDRYVVDQGTVEIIPRELGLGNETRPEKWLFTILNQDQIVQAEPFISDHGLHPVAVAEPGVQGYGLGNPGTIDYTGPLQDAISWLFNSHMDNVRKVINDSLVVDPKMIVMKDLKPEENEVHRIIRLKESMLGSDVKQAIYQLPVQDVTRGHIADIQVLFGINERITGVSDNMMGFQDLGGRKTATEVRTAAGAASSRLAHTNRLVSAQQMVPLAEMMTLNNQQYLSDDFFIMITGEEGAKAPIRVSPEMIVGDFYFPQHDGTLPLDRVALLDVWKEIMTLILGSPVLQQSHELPRVFEYVADLGGARNIETMRRAQVPSNTPVMPQPDGAVEDQARRGNLVPITPDVQRMMM